MQMTDYLCFRVTLGSLRGDGGERSSSFVVQVRTRLAQITFDGS